jgi:hypothetical protein
MPVIRLELQRLNRSPVLNLADAGQPVSGPASTPSS